WRKAEAVAKRAAKGEVGVSEVDRTLGFDSGRSERTGRPEDDRAYKTPTLRDVARRGPYMHDGSLATLEDVVRHYASAPKDPNLDASFPSFSPSEREVKDLAAFLRSLSSDVQPRLASDWTARARSTTVYLVDVDHRPLA